MKKSIKYPCLPAGRQVSSMQYRASSGFTLIETLIYSALITLITTFSILAVYQLIDASDRGENLEQLNENQRFLEQKIYWTLQSVSSINSPAIGATSTTLSVDKIGFAENPVVIDTLSDTARIKRGVEAANLITNDSYVAVRDLAFHQFNFSGKPAIKITGTLFNSFTSTTLSINTTILVK